MDTNVVTSMFNQDLLTVLTKYSAGTFPLVAIVSLVIYMVTCDVFDIPGSSDVVR